MKNILLVDDDPEILELLKFRLESNGHKVHIATDGMEGFIKAKDILPDMIVLDISMPNLDGYELTKELKRDLALKDIPILILTAKSHTQNLFEEIDLCDFMMKPFDTEDFMLNINNYLTMNQN